MAAGVVVLSIAAGLYLAAAHRGEWQAGPVESNRLRAAVDLLASSAEMMPQAGDEADGRRSAALLAAVGLFAAAIVVLSAILLQREMGRRARLAADLRSLNAGLEAAVDERMAALMDVNARLRGEIEAHLHTEEGRRAATARAAALAKLGEDAVKTRAVGPLLERAVELLAEHLRVEFVEVLELRSDGDFLLRSGIGWGAGVVGSAVVTGASTSQAGYTLLSDAPVVVEDLGAEDRFEAPGLLTSHGIVSGMSAPVRTPPGAWGVVGVHTAQRRSFAAGEVDFLRAVANLLGSAVARATAEESLRRDERILRARTEATHEGYVLLDRELRLSAVSPAVKAVGGYEPDEILGRTPLEFTHPDDAEGAAAVLARVLAQPGRTEGYSARCRHRDGSWLWIEFNCLNLLDDALVGGLLLSFQDVDARKRAELAAATLLDQLRALTVRMRRLREEESARIAREIHDDLGQQLTAMKFDLAWLRQRATDDAMRLRLEGTEELVGETIRSVRRIASDLRPDVLDNLGLVPALEWEVERFRARTGIDCRVAAALPADGTRTAVDAETSTAVFRILQEALTNVARHAEARHVHVSLRQDDGRLRLEVADDGRGMAAGATESRDALGILGMRERASLLGGELIIRPGSPGTVVIVSVPRRREERTE